MTTARLLTGRPQVEIDEDGLRVLSRGLAVDLGVSVLPLHDWRAAHPERGQLVTLSLSVTTVIRVEAGFRYDGASIPGLALPLMGARELYECAGLLHDALYRRQAPRVAADRVFWIVARSGSRRVGRVRGWLGWAALRAFGWLAYRRRGMDVRKAS